MKEIGKTAPAAAAAAKSLQSCPTLCDPRDSSPQAPLSLGYSRKEHWSGLPFSSPMHAPHSFQLCLALCDPMDSSPPSSSVHRILQARILEWVAIAFFMERLQLDLISVHHRPALIRNNWLWVYTGNLMEILHFYKKEYIEMKFTRHTINHFI